MQRACGRDQLRLSGLGGNPQPIGCVLDVLVRCSLDYPALGATRNKLIRIVHGYVTEELRLSGLGGNPQLMA